MLVVIAALSWPAANRPRQRDCARGVGRIHLEEHHEELKEVPQVPIH
jgi:hypothetical protein